MKSLYFAFLGVFTLTYLAYLAWLAGYQAGYDQGADKAWAQACRAVSAQIPDGLSASADEKDSAAYAEP